MKTLRRIEEKIKEKHQEITDVHKMPVHNFFVGPSREEILDRLNAELERSETERRFILDRRESWMPKTIWNIIVPIIVSVAVALIARLF